MRFSGRPARPGRLRTALLPRTAIALDLGSDRTRACVPGRGVIFDVPTITFPGASHPVQRGTIVDAAGTARMLRRLLHRHTSRFARPVFVVTTPVLGGVIYREAARSALEFLRPYAVHTVPTARAIALGADADLSRPLLVVDFGAHLTEVFVLSGGAVSDARRTPLGTCDLDGTTTRDGLVDAVVAMVTGMLRQDRTPTTLDALRRGVLVAGGGALRPGTARLLGERLDTPVRTAPAPHAAAVRGAAALLPGLRHRPPAPDPAAADPSPDSRP
ncbi:rod shape-determining protein [Streptomyces sp. NRRL S-1868]|uniref:rod shape-determining protein n=1 Tax=Streptomyces TaxID=1883 RepID=UPI000D146A0E